MASSGPHSGEATNDFDLLVVSLLVAMTDAEGQVAVHRTTLQALVEAMQAEPEWREGAGTIPAHTGGLRRAIADALINLRQHGLVIMNNKGFAVTPSGRKAVSSTDKLSAEHERLLRFVGKKSQEWRSTA